MATTSSRPQFIRPQKKTIMLTELQSKLNERRDKDSSPEGERNPLFTTRSPASSPKPAGKKGLSLPSGDHFKVVSDPDIARTTTKVTERVDKSSTSSEGEQTSQFSGGDVPTGSPARGRPVAKSRSLSSGDRFKVVVNPEVTRTSGELNERADKESENEGSPRLSVDSPPVSPTGDRRPVAKSRSLSSGDRYKVVVSPNVAKSSNSKPVLVTKASNAAGKSEKKSKQQHSISSPQLIKPSGRSLGNVRHIAPPPSKPPPLLEANNNNDKQPLLSLARSPAMKRKRIAFKKKAASQANITVVVQSESTIDSNSKTPPTGTYRYQNIFDFESKETRREKNDLTMSPKKPMPLPRSNSISVSRNFPSNVTFPLDTPSPFRSDHVTMDDHLILDDPLISRRSDTRKFSRRGLQRRTTKREARQLRNGVCSDGETDPLSSDDDADDYILMNPGVSLHSPLLSIPIRPTTFDPLATTTDPRASGYYLKILPNSFFPAVDHVKKTSKPKRRIRALSEQPPGTSTNTNSKHGKSLSPTSSELDSPSKLPDLSLSSSEVSVTMSLVSHLMKTEETPDSPGSDYVEMSIPWTRKGGFKGEEEVVQSGNDKLLCMTNWIDNPDWKDGSSTGNVTQSMPIYQMRLPQEEDPVIKDEANLLSALKVNPILKYSDVTIHPVDPVLPKVQTLTKKFKYQTIKVGQDESSLSTDHPSHFTVDAAFMSQPVPVPKILGSHAQISSHDPTVTCSLTTSHPVTAPPITGSPPHSSHTLTAAHPLQLPWHQYVEVDADVLTTIAESAECTNPLTESSPTHSFEHNLSKPVGDSSPYKDTPPNIPERPDDLDDWADSRIRCSDVNCMSGDYSYTPVFGQGISGLEWMGKHRRSPLSGSVEKLVDSSSALLPTATPIKFPPSIHPKTASLLREVGIDHFNKSTANPYLTPVTTIPKQIPPKNAISPKAKGRTSPTKSIGRVLVDKQGSNKQRVPPSLPPPYKGKPGCKLIHMASSAPNLSYLADQPGQLDAGKTPPKTPPTRQKDRHMSEQMDSHKPQRPLRSSKVNPLPNGGDVSFVLSSSPDITSRPQLQLPSEHSLNFDLPSPVREDVSSLSSNTSNNNNFSSSPEAESDAVVCLQDLGTESEPLSPPCCCNLSSHVGETSLAVITQNRGEIVRRLSQRRTKDTGMESGQVNAAEQAVNGTGTTGEQAVNGIGTEQAVDEPSSATNYNGVATLDKVISELDTILRSRLCSEAELISAIESSLKIQLRPQGGSKDEKEVPLESSGDSHFSYHQNLEESLEGVVSDMCGESKPRSDTFLVHDSYDEDSESVTPTIASGIKFPTHLSPVHYTSPRQPESDHPVNFHSRSSSSPAKVRCDTTFNARTRSATSFDVSDNLGHHDNDGDMQDGFPPTRESRSYSAGWDQSPLRRVNAQRRPSAASQSQIPGITFNNGEGTFTSRGGTLTNEDSDIVIDVPEGAVAKGKRQKLWFKVVQATFDPKQTDDISKSSWSDSSNNFELTMSGKKDGRIQLSPVVMVGPSDASLLRPIRIRLPHCLPYRNNSWHLQVLGRATDSSINDEWVDIINTIGLVNVTKRKRKMSSYKETSYHMSLEHSVISTTELGHFKLTGRPMRNGSHSAKKMLAFVLFKPTEQVGGQVDLEVFLTDALTDHTQALEHTLATPTYLCLKRNIPVVCFGDGKDLEVSVNSSSHTIPLGSKIIPFGQFWRQKLIGQSRVSFQIDHTFLAKSRTLTLSIQQAGSHTDHQSKFIVP